MPAYLTHEDGPLKGQVLTLDGKETWLIGRDPDGVDFVLEDSTVSRKHARLTLSDDGIALENLSRVNPTLINDEKRSGKTLLHEGDRIQIGHSTFVFSEDASKERPARSKYDNVFDDVHTPEEPPPPSQKDQDEPSAYDTIFEDTAEEPPLSFHILSETPLLLKVISGPNAGAEIGIEKGRSYTIGKDPNTCDIVFQDLSVSRNHARLTVNDEGEIEIEDLGSKNGTSIGGVPIQEKTRITTQDLISLGTTVFLLIDREAPQETIYSPLVPSQPQISHDADAGPATAEEEAARIEKETDWKKKPIPTKHLVAGAGFIFACLIVFLSFFSLFKPNAPHVAHKEPVGEIKKALAPYEEVQFTYNPGSGKLFLVGHVLTGVEKQELEYRLSEISFITSLENNIVVDEYVWKTMNDVLSENTPWTGVSIHSTKPGKFSIGGFVQTNAEYAALADYLSLNFPYLDRLENRVIVSETLTTQLESLLAAHGFSAITFETANGEIILSGRYSNKMEKDYQKFITQIRSIPGITSVKTFAVATAPNQAAIDLSKNYQVTGTTNHDGKGYNVILNGRIYALGDDVQGMKITTIEKNTILLEKDGLKYRIDYTR